MFIYEIFWCICFHWPISILDSASLNISTWKATYFPLESVQKSTTMQILSGPGHQRSNFMVYNITKKPNSFYVALWLGKTLQEWSRNPGNDKPSKVSVPSILTQFLWPEWIHFMVLIAYNLSSSYQNNDITEFEKILKTNHSNIMDDPFIREHIEGQFGRLLASLYIILLILIH